MQPGAPADGCPLCLQVSRLTGLVHLHLEECGVQGLPTEISTLRNLRKLALVSNPLEEDTALPASMVECTGLQVRQSAPGTAWHWAVWRWLAMELPIWTVWCDPWRPAAHQIAPWTTPGSPEVPRAEALLPQSDMPSLLAVASPGNPARTLVACLPSKSSGHLLTASSCLLAAPGPYGSCLHGLTLKWPTPSLCG